MKQVDSLLQKVVTYTGTQDYSHIQGILAGSLEIRCHVESLCDTVPLNSHLTKIVSIINLLNTDYEKYSSFPELKKSIDFLTATVYRINQKLNTNK